MIRENPFINIYKSCNSGTSKEKYYLIKSGKLQLPRYMDIELTNNCNFRCVFCPTGTGAMRRNKGFMSDEVIDKILSDVTKYKIPGVRFIRWGEPTIHPKFLETMRRFKDAGVAVHFNTNGSIDRDCIEALVDMKLDSIKFSFQGADKGTYEEMRERGGYYELLDTVRLMADVRGDALVPYIQISTTLTDESESQVESFKRDIEGICDYYNIGYTKLNHLNVADMKVDDEKKKKNSEMQEHESKNIKFHDTCFEAFDKLSVNWNGDVTLCCSDYDNFMIVGNILDMDIKQIFNSKAADNYRKLIVENKHHGIKCCSECYETVPLR